MFAKSFVLFGGLLISTLGNAEASDTSVIADRNENSPVGSIQPEMLIWQPEIDGLARYQMKLPIRGVEDSLKYNDAAELYYLAQQYDLGLHFTDKIDDLLEVTFSRDKIETNYLRGFSPTTSYILGFVASDSRLTPSLGLTSRKVQHGRSLEHYTLSLSNTTPTLSWSRSSLQQEEQIESLLYASLIDQDIGMAYGQRWFSILNDTDLLAELSVRKGQGVLGLQFERSFGVVNTRLGLVSNVSANQNEAFFSIALKLDGKVDIFLKQNDELMTSFNPSIKAFRREKLSKLWRLQYSHKTD